MGFLVSLTQRKTHSLLFLKIQSSICVKYSFWSGNIYKTLITLLKPVRIVRLDISNSNPIGGGKLKAKKKRTSYNMSEVKNSLVFFPCSEVSRKEKHLN